MAYSKYATEIKDKDNETYGIMDEECREEVTNLKSAVTYTREDVVRIDENGKIYLKGNFVRGSINTSGEVYTFPQRVVTENIIYYSRDIVIHFDSAFQYLYATYQNDGTFIQRVSGTADISVTAGTRFRLCIIKTVQPDLADINEFVDAVTIKSKAEVRFTKLESDVIDLQENQEDVSTDITYTLGHYIKTDGSIGDLATYAISNVIELKYGETIKIYENGGTASIVSMLSEWDSTGTTFIRNLYTCTGDVYENITHTADHNEYLKICYYASRNLPVVKIKGVSTNSLADDILDLKNMTVNMFADISMFDDIAVCGDSYTSGQIYQSGSLVGDNVKTRWGAVLGRLTGANVTTYASGGADTSSWQTRSDCLPKLLTDDPHELYVLCLGINDRTYTTKGTAEDMAHAGTPADPFPNTFYGNYASIITQIQTHAPNAKIVISKVFIVTLQTGAYYQWSSEAIEDIAEYFSIPYVDTADADFFSSNWFNSSMSSAHPIAATYAGIAKAMRYLLSKSIMDNTSYYADYYPA